MSGFSPDSAPCLPVAPGAPAAVLPVRAGHLLLRGCAGRHIGSCRWTGSVALCWPGCLGHRAAKQQHRRSPSRQRALNAIALIRCLPSLGPTNALLQGVQFVSDRLFDQELRRRGGRRVAPAGVRDKLNTYRHRPAFCRRTGSPLGAGHSTSNWLRQLDRFHRNVSQLLRSDIRSHPALGKLSGQA